MHPTIQESDAPSGMDVLQTIT